jgi:hypothetical protein
MRLDTGLTLWRRHSAHALLDLADAEPNGGVDEGGAAPGSMMMMGSYREEIRRSGGENNRGSKEGYGAEIRTAFGEARSGIKLTAPNTLGRCGSKWYSSRSRRAVLVSQRAELHACGCV